MISTKLEHDVSIVSQNNESEVPATKKKTDLGWVTGLFSCANGHVKLHVKPPGFNHTSPRFRTIFHGCPLWVIQI